jgi:hypothetical protein
MRKAPSFTVDINAIRIPALKMAKARRDRTTAARVEKLCGETLELVNNYLDEEKVKELRDELAEMRQLARDEAAAEGQAKAAVENPAEAAKKQAGGKKKARKKASVNTVPPAESGAGTAASPAPPIKAGRITIEGLVTADPLPAGYTVTRNEMIDNGESLGYHLLFAKRGSKSMISATILTEDFTARADRIAAAKTYVNTAISHYGDKGFKLVEQRVPEIDNANLQQKLIVELIFDDPNERSKFLLQMQIFFGKSSYNVAIAAYDKDDYEMLARWALSMQEKASAGTGGPVPPNRPSF